MAKSFRRVASLFGAVVFSFSVTQTVLFPNRALAAATGVVVGSPVSGMHSTNIPITGVSFTGTGTIPVTLRVSYGTLTLGVTTGLTLTTASSDVDFMAFSGDIADVNTALASLTYNRSGETGEDTLEVSALDDTEVYYGGHIYEYVDMDGIDWDSSLTAAAGLTKYGETGYLTTITSAEENDYVAARLMGDGWMGASDALSEGDWQWVTGPETGTSFWSGASEGSPVSGRYNAWAGGEPNDSDSNEDCGQFYVEGGTWNDLPCAGGMLEGFVVEYGDTTPIDIVSDTLAINVTANTHQIETCQELADLDQYTTYLDTIRLMNDIDCQGVEVNPLYDDSDFVGEFDGQGYSIHNLVINQPETTEVALFSKTNDGAYIHDLTLASGSVTGSGDVGALIGELEEGTTIESVVSHVNVSGNTDVSNVGGLVGYIDEDYDDPGDETTTISDSASMGNVMGGYYVGGLVGRLTSDGSSSVTIERSFATGDVTAEWEDAGGLVGNIETEGWDDGASVTLRNVYAWGGVQGGANGVNVGGLVGLAEVYDDGGPTSLTIENAYAKGSVTAYENVGGLVGRMYEMYNDTSATIQNSYAAGAVTATNGTNVGGLVGGYMIADNEINSVDNFYDRSGTTQANCSGDATIDDCTAVNVSNAAPDYFINNNTNAPMTAWNFSSVWVTNPGMHPIFSAISYDVDGVTNEVENAAPNNGDGNGDGTIDSLQTNVTSLPNDVAGGGAYVTIEADPNGDCSSITTVTQGAEEDYDIDNEFDYPVGLTDFALSCTTPGGSTTIVVYYDTEYDTSDWVVRKFVNGEYATVESAVFSTATVGADTVTVLTYELTDGGELDDDGLANGVIVDPVGPAVLAATDATTTGAPNTGLATASNVGAILLLVSGLAIAGSTWIGRRKEI